MKRKVFWFVILFIFSLILIGCPTDNKKYNGPIQVKFEFTGEKFDATKINPSAVVFNSSTARSARTYSSLNDIDVDTFAELNEFYASLGELKEVYTPTEFNVFVGRFEIFGINLYNELSFNEYMNFNSPIVFELSEYNIKPGMYNGINFLPSFINGLVGLGTEGGEYSQDELYDTNKFLQKNPSVTFTIPGGVGEGHPFEYSVFEFSKQIPNARLDTQYDLIVTGDTYKIAPGFLFPNYSSYITGRNWVNCGDDFTFSSADVLLLITNKLDDFELDENYWNDSGIFWGYTELGGWATHQPSWYPDNYSTLIAPFSGITIPEGAYAVKFTLYWDLENIIERYEGDTDATSDDIYIIANKYWERLVLTAEIEYP